MVEYRQRQINKNHEHLISDKRQEIDTGKPRWKDTRVRLIIYGITGKECLECCATGK